jgi:hypothetical protein
MEVTMTPKLTFHVQEQIRKMGEQGIAVTVAEILHAINNIGEFPTGVQTRVIVKNFGTKVQWKDGEVEKSGDLLIALVDRENQRDEGRIVTAMVRKSSQDNSPTKKRGVNDARYKKGW